MEFTVQTKQEIDGRWIAEVPELPGATAYGGSRAEAVARVKALALHVLADQLESGDTTAGPVQRGARAPATRRLGELLADLEGDREDR